MTANSPISEIEKSFENFTSSILNIEKAYGKISRKIDAYRANEIVPRDYLKEMAGNLAHEIRNPLGGIANLVELLSQDTESGHTKNIQGILDGIHRIDEIVENLIVFSRPLVLKPVDCNFADIINTTVATVKAKIKSEVKKYNFKVSVQAEEVYVKIDPLLMPQAIQNILFNSVEFMPDGGKIEVDLLRRQKDNRVVLKIKDNGPGLPEGNTEKPFYPFFTTKTHGMGLGLPTSRLIVEKHGGFIQIKSKKGVEVTFTLPKY